MTGPCVTELISTCYAPEPNDRKWLEAVHREAGRTFPDSVAVVLAVVDVKPDGGADLQDIVGPSELCDFAKVGTGALEASDTRQLFLKGPVVCVNDIVRRSPTARLKDLFFATEASRATITSVSGTDPSGRALVLSLLQQGKPSPRLRVALGRLAGQFAAALRLRLRPETQPAAWLDPSGRVLDAEGDAVADRAALRRQALAMERARREETDDPAAALGSWKALVEGRWTVVERFESDGRRLLIARRNEPETWRLYALSEPERKVVAFLRLSHPAKLIAYELGYSEVMVSRLTQSALRKLGLRTRAELIELHGALGPSVTDGVLSMGDDATRASS